MFKRILLASAVVTAFAVGGLGTARSAEAGGYHHHPPHCGYGAPYASPYGVGYVPPRRSAYYRYSVAPAPYRYGAYYGAPGYYGAYNRGPAFRLSIGF